MATIAAQVAKDIRYEHNAPSGNNGYVSIGSIADAHDIANQSSDGRAIRTAYKGRRVTAYLMEDLSVLTIDHMDGKPKVVRGGQDAADIRRGIYAGA